MPEEENGSEIRQMLRNCLYIMPRTGSKLLLMFKGLLRPAKEQSERPELS